MNLPNLFSTAVFLGAACLVSGQSRGIQTPLSGYAFDAGSHTLRAIRGMPGAAVIGNPVGLAVEVQAAKISANREFAVVINRDPAGQVLLFRGLNGDAPTSQPIEGAIAAVDLISLNDAGTVAAILSKTSQQLQFISGLPDHPVAHLPVPIDSVLGQATALALAQRGQSVLVTSSDGSYGGVYQVADQEGASPQLLAAAFQPSAVIYLNQDQDAAFADVFSHEIVQLQSLSLNTTSRVLVSAQDNVANPIAIQASNGSVIAVSNSATPDSSFGKLIQYDLASHRIVADRPLPVAATRLDTLGDGGVFVINDCGTDVLYLYSSDDFSWTFVPLIANGVACAVN